MAERAFEFEGAGPPRPATQAPTRPFRIRPRSNGDLLLVDDGGRFFQANAAFVDRLESGRLTDADARFLETEGHGAAAPNSLTELARRREAARRLTIVGPLDYLILVPTLRCNLSCSYCQVSRAAVGAVGYDWSEETLQCVFALLDGLETNSIKIEFQGGEVTLRLDVVERVIERCERFGQKQFVICTNLSRVDDAFLAVADREDVFISTSLDGDADTHQANRTHAAA
ncbi:MAG: radical SAM protein, partial [Allosphingosinicella sp.]